MGSETTPSDFKIKGMKDPRKDKYKKLPMQGVITEGKGLASFVSGAWKRV